MSSVFDGSLGAFQVGTILSTFLLGVTATQAWHYYSNFPRDKKLYWWIVTFLLAMDWSHTAICCYTIYVWQVTQYGNIAYLANSPFSFAIDPAMTGIVAFVVQAFYAYRVFVVAKRKVFFPIVIVSLSLISMGFACGATGMIFKLQAFAKFQSWTYGVNIWLGTAAAADLIITGSLCWYLAKSKSTSFVATDSVLNKLIESVISTNGLTAAVALIDAVLFSTLSSSYHVTANLCLIKLYFNSLLVSLNARVELERQIMGNSRAFSHLNKHSGTNSSTIGAQSLTTAIGFGAADISPQFAKTCPKGVLVQTTQTTLISDDNVNEVKSLDDDDKDPMTRTSTRTALSSPAMSPQSTPRQPYSRPQPPAVPELHILNRGDGRASARSAGDAERGL